MAVARGSPYPFRYKPQDPMERPGIYAPYQPRFEWNLWFASLAPWQASPWVVAAQARLLRGEPRRALTLPARSLQGSATHDGAHGALAVLVYKRGGEAQNGRVVDARVSR